MNMILDGTGNGNRAAVTVNNRLMTTGVDLTLIEAASETGDTYNINIDTAALTTSGESALFYLKNNEDRDLVIDGFIANIINYVGTAGQPIFRVYRNPQTGTLISSATSGNVSNRNYGSNNLLDVDAFQGVEGSTINGEDNVIEIFLPTVAAVTLVAFDTIVVLPTGASLCLSYEPPSGVTSVDVVLAVTCTLNGSQL